MSEPAIAEIHDLGYRRYDGERTPPAARFRVIARNVVAVAWRGRLITKLAVVLAVGTTIAAAVAMYILRSALAQMVSMRGAPLPQAEQIIFHAEDFYEASAFILAALWGSAAIADDLRLGAFQFYFSRALLPRDYVAGKLVGLGLLVGIPMFAGPVVLAVFRLLLADGWRDALALAPVLPRAALLGLLGTAAYVLPVAGMGALARRRQVAQALFAVYWLLVCPAVWSLSWPFRLPWLRLASLPSDLTVIGRALFGVARDHHDPPTWAASVSLALIAGAGFAAVWRTVHRAAHEGLGGS
jgi:hypothetical protein